MSTLGKQAVVSRARLWQCLLLAVAIGIGTLVPAPNARAVVLSSEGAGRNITPPSSNEGLAGWNLQGSMGGFLGTPIAPQYFIAAQHVDPTMSITSITLGSQTYHVDKTFRGTGCVDDAGSDLRIYRIQETFPTYAPLYNAAVDGTEFNKILTVFGRGTQRGAEVNVGTLRGWQWGTSDSVQSWGQNVVSGTGSYRSSQSLLLFNFDQNGIANEAGLSAGDSSGGVFILSQGQWKLAGINYGVNSPWSTTGIGGKSTGFNADIFDARGLYLWDDGTSSWFQVPSEPTNPVPGYSAASRISARLPWILSVVPEPGSVALLTSGAPVLLLLVWRLRRANRAAVTRTS